MLDLTRILSGPFATMTLADLGADVITIKQRKLAARADVLVQNFRPGTAAGPGFGFEDLSKVNPGLVHASIGGYGQTRPEAKRAGYDAIAQARSRIMSVTGEAGRPPVTVT